MNEGKEISMRKLPVHVVLMVNEKMTGQRGADNLHYALEAACAATAESFMRTHSGVLSWEATRHDTELAVEPVGR